LPLLFVEAGAHCMREPQHSCMLLCVRPPRNSTRTRSRARDAPRCSSSWVVRVKPAGSSTGGATCCRAGGSSGWGATMEALHPGVSTMGCTAQTRLSAPAHALPAMSRTWWREGDADLQADGCCGLVGRALHRPHGCCRCCCCVATQGCRAVRGHGAHDAAVLPCARPAVVLLVHQLQLLTHGHVGKHLPLGCLH
jgi:hypothetical protein